MPATPGAELAERIRETLSQDMERIGKSVRVVETGGVKLKDSLVRADLTGFFWLDCLLCRDNAPGNHNRRGAKFVLILASLQNMTEKLDTVVIKESIWDTKQVLCPGI